jgi:hypothetical protein
MRNCRVEAATDRRMISMRLATQIASAEGLESSRDLREEGPVRSPTRSRCRLLLSSLAARERSPVM